MSAAMHEFNEVIGYWLAVQKPLILIQKKNRKEVCVDLNCHLASVVRFLDLFFHDLGWNDPTNSSILKIET
jgi:hypothetical protein